MHQWVYPGMLKEATIRAFNSKSFSVNKQNISKNLFESFSRFILNVLFSFKEATRIAKATRVAKAAARTTTFSPTGCNSSPASKRDFWIIFPLFMALIARLLHFWEQAKKKASSSLFSLATWERTTPSFSQGYRPVHHRQHGLWEFDGSSQVLGSSLPSQ